MGNVRVIATHDVVARLHPRPPRTEQDEKALIAGRIIDSTLARCNHDVREGRRPTTSAMLGAAEVAYDEEVRDAGLPMVPEERARLLEQVAGVLRAFRASPIYGLSRPRSRWVLINGEVGLFAQPDFWDGRSRIYEMKSFRPDPIPPDVRTQVRCFQLAFPRFEAFVIGFDRHSTPVGTTFLPVGSPTPGEMESTLRAALVVGRETGASKVMEYLDPPAAAYAVAAASDALFPGEEARGKGLAPTKSLPP